MRFHCLDNNGDENEPLDIIKLFFNILQNETASVECEFNLITSKEAALNLLPAEAMNLFQKEIANVKSHGEIAVEYTSKTKNSSIISSGRSSQNG